MHNTIESHLVKPDPGSPETSKLFLSPIYTESYNPFTYQPPNNFGNCDRDTCYVPSDLSQIVLSSAEFNETHEFSDCFQK